MDHADMIRRMITMMRAGHAISRQRASGAPKLIWPVSAWKSQKAPKTCALARIRVARFATSMSLSFLLRNFFENLIYRELPYQLRQEQRNHIDGDGWILLALRPGPEQLGAPALTSLK